MTEPRPVGLADAYAELRRQQRAERAEQESRMADTLREAGYLVVAPGETVIATPGLYLMKEDTGRVFVDRRSDPEAARVLRNALTTYLEAGERDG